jgi:hypothetical protein
MQRYAEICQGTTKDRGAVQCYEEFLHGIEVDGLPITLKNSVPCREYLGLHFLVHAAGLSSGLGAKPQNDTRIQSRVTVIRSWLQAQPIYGTQLTDSLCRK